MILNSNIDINLLSENKEVSYENLIADDLSGLSFYTQNKKNFECKKVLASENKWGRNPEMLLMQDILTDNLKSIYDFCGGKRNEESYNFLIDLKNEALINNVHFISPKSYYPTIMNIYLGDDKEKIFDKSAVATKKFVGAEANGDYNFDFEPQFVRYVRIEILDNINTYYGDMLVIPISFLGVFGYKGVYSDNFGNNIKNILSNTKTKCETLLQPFLYKTNSGWINSLNQKSNTADFEDMPAEKLGESYTTAEFKSGNIINIGLTNDPTMISNLREGVNLKEYADIYFYLKSSVDSRLAFQIVSVYDKWFEAYLNVNKGWQKYNLRCIMSDGKIAGFSSENPDKNLKRIAVIPMGGYDGEIIVGSIVANRYVDWNSKDLDLSQTDDWSVEKWCETLKSIDLTDIDTEELDLFLENFKV